MIETYITGFGTQTTGSERFEGIGTGVLHLKHKAPVLLWIDSRKEYKWMVFRIQ